MPRPPILVTLSFVTSGLVWALRLAFAPDPFAAASAALVAFSLLVGSAVAAAGVLIAHGRWSRRLALTTVAAEAGLGIVMPLDAWSWVGMVAVAGALIALTGPWLDGWLRRMPAAGGPGLTPMVAALSGVALPGIVGIANPAGPRIAHWILAAAAVVIAWGFGRAHGWGLWGMRLILPVLALWAAVVAPPPGAVLIVVATGGAVAAAWSRPSLLAVYPLFDDLPGPRRARPDGAGVTP